jgi:hypothetical protein
MYSLSIVKLIEHADYEYNIFLAENTSFKIPSGCYESRRDIDTISSYNWKVGLSGGNIEEVRKH